jgi:hypothetical protein
MPRFMDVMKKERKKERNQPTNKQSKEYGIRLMIIDSIWIFGHWRAIFPREKEKKKRHEKKSSYFEYTNRPDQIKIPNE